MKSAAIWVKCSKRGRNASSPVFITLWFIELQRTLHTTGRLLQFQQSFDNAGIDHFITNKINRTGQDV
jgi:hypothetical protein